MRICFHKTCLSPGQCSANLSTILEGFPNTGIIPFFKTTDHIHNGITHSHELWDEPIFSSFSTQANLFRPDNLHTIKGITSSLLMRLEHPVIRPFLD